MKQSANDIACVVCVRASLYVYACVCVCVCVHREEGQDIVVGFRSCHAYSITHLRNIY